MYFFTDTNDGNLAYHVGDIIQNVDENREKLAKKLGYETKDLVYMNQVHGSNIVIVDEKSSKLIYNFDLIGLERKIKLERESKNYAYAFVFRKNENAKNENFQRADNHKYQFDIESYLE